jgi:hypothetical protein
MVHVMPSIQNSALRTTVLLPFSDIGDGAAKASPLDAAQHRKPSDLLVSMTTASLSSDSLLSTMSVPHPETGSFDRLWRRGEMLLSNKDASHRHKDSVQAQWKVQLQASPQPQRMVLLLHMALDVIMGVQLYAFGQAMQTFKGLTNPTSLRRIVFLVHS